MSKIKDEELLLGAITRVENKQEIIQNDIAEIKVTLAKQHVSIDEHIKRTNLLESKLQRVEEVDIEPIKKHVLVINNTLKVLGLLCTFAAGIIGAVVGGLEIIKFFNKL